MIITDMTITELIERYGRERIARAVVDLKPGGRCAGCYGGELRMAYVVEYAVLKAVGADNREFNPSLWEPGCTFVDDGAHHRIHADYELPAPPEGDRPAGGHDACLGHADQHSR